MGSVSMSCADGGISRATAGGRDGAAVTCNGGKGSMRRVTWGGCWCDHSTRVATRHGGCTRLAKVIQWQQMGMAMCSGVTWTKWRGPCCIRLSMAGGARWWLVRCWHGLAMMGGGNSEAG